MEIPNEITHRDLIALVRKRFADHETMLTILHEQRDVKGYCLAARAFDVEMAGHIPLIVAALEAVVISVEEKHAALMTAEARANTLQAESNARVQRLFSGTYGERERHITAIHRELAGLYDPSASPGHCGSCGGTYSLVPISELCIECHNK